VKTSDDLVEVTSQACGIQGFGNTTVKLTKQQYQNLEQYLVDFRTRLNQTTTRGEAVPIFKDAVVELNKYGLLPKGMSIRQAVDLTTGRYMRGFTLPKSQPITGVDENFLCLIAGRGNPVFRYLGLDLLMGLIRLLGNFNIAWFLSALWLLLTLVSIPFMLSIIKLNTALYFGVNSNPVGKWVWTQGLNGVQKWDGPFWGDIIEVYPEFFDFFGLYYSVGATNFIGLKMSILDFYFGSVSWIKLTNSYPWGGGNILIPRASREKFQGRS
jgi:hypothetical protein